jgi:hypothetical protein
MSKKTIEIDNWQNYKTIMSFKKAFNFDSYACSYIKSFTNKV